MAESLPPSDSTSSSEGLDFESLSAKEGKRVWHKWLNIEGGILPGIEAGCFTYQLLAEHAGFFTPEEEKQLLAKILVAPLHDVLERIGPVILHAVYESLKATEERGGARAHCKMADNLRECFQKVVAERKTQPSSAIDSSSGPPDGGWFQGSEVELDRRPLPATPSQGETGQSQNPQNWATFEFAASFAKHICDEMTGHELSLFANELVTEGRPVGDRRSLTERIQGTVLTNEISLFSIAIGLLGKNALFKYVFEISKYTKASVSRAWLDRCLNSHLGSEWKQLALSYSLLHASDIDDIHLQHPKDIRAQIAAFHARCEGFPRLPEKLETMSLLVQILCYANLRDVAKNVCEELSRMSGVPCEKINRDLATGDNILTVFKNHSAPEYPHSENLQEQHHQQQQQQHCQEERSAGVVSNGSPTPSHQCTPSYWKFKAAEPALMEIPIYKDELDAFEDETQTENLLAKWAEPLAKNRMYLVRQKDRKQAVHYAAELGYADLMAFLFACDHNGRAVMEEGKTPFLIACEEGHLSVVKMLIAKYGSSILKERDEKDRTCLHFPQVYRNKGLFQYLLFDLHANAIATTKTGVLPLSVAALVGDQQAVDQLLAMMYPNDTPVPSRMPPLHCAVLANHIGIVKCLMNSGFSIISDINSKSQDGFTALHIAAARGHLEIVEFLVKQDQCSVNEESNDGSTPLLLAAICNHPQIAKCLLYCGANVEYHRMVRKGVYHISPIGEAALGRNVEVAAVLMEAGANIMFKSGGTVSVLDHACIGGSEESVLNLLPKIIERTINGDNSSRNFLSLMKSAFKVSVTFESFTVARIILQEVMTQLAAHSEEEAFQQLLNTTECDYELHSAIENYKELCAALGSELPNKGNSIRRVAGDRSSVLYYIGYDDGPHWGTEVMHLTLLFENLKMPMKFRSAYHRVYMEATNTVLNSVMRFHYDVSRESLVAQALSLNFQEAGAFFNNKKLFTRFADPQEYVDQGQAGSTSLSGISMVCSMASQQMIDESFGMESLTGEQYFMEVAKRNSENPLSCPYALRYSCDTSGQSKSGGSISTQDASGLTQLEHLQKAIDRGGAVNLDITRCILIGPPRVGKSCFKHLLVHNEPKKKENNESTPIMEAPVVLTSMWCQTEKECTWTELTRVDLENLVSKCAKKKDYTCTKQSDHISTAEKDYVVVPDDHNSTAGSSAIQHTTQSKPSPLKLTLTPNLSDSKSTTDEQAQTITAPQQRAELDLVNPGVSGNLTTLSQKLSKFVSAISDDEIVYNLNRLKLIHVFDCGGQLAFQDTIPLLIDTPCTFIAVFKASVHLDEEVELTYCLGDQELSSDDKELPSGHKELPSGHKEPLPLGHKELPSSHKELPSGHKELHSGHNELPSGHKELPSGHKETQWNMLLRIFSSIHSLQCKSHLGVMNFSKDPLVHSSPIVVVGTHKDELDKLVDCDSIKTDIESRLQDLKESKPYIFLRKGRILDLVGNLGRDDLDQVGSLRQVISQTVNFSQKLPLPWLILELFTWNNLSSQTFYSYCELKELCRPHPLLMDESEFRSCIQVLHTLGFYAFYPLEGVPEDQNWVCADAATLYKEVSKVLMVQHMKVKYPTTDNFKKTGEISLTEESLKELFEDLNIKIGAANPQWLMHVMCHVGLAAQIEKEKVFIPLALPSNQSDIPPTTSVAPLRYAFDFQLGSSRYVLPNKTEMPRGIFPRLVVLLSDHCPGRWKWKLGPAHSERSCMGLKFRPLLEDSTYEVYLKESICHIEASIVLRQAMFSKYVNIRDRIEKINSLCKKIHTTLTSALKTAFEQLYGTKCKPNVVYGFACLKCNSSNCIAIIPIPLVDESSPQPDEYVAECMLRRQQYRLTIEQLIWFNPGPVNPKNVEFNCMGEILTFRESSSLTVPAEVIKSTTDLLPYLTQMLSHLRLLGSALNIAHVSSAIVAGAESPTEKCLAILQNWLECTPQPTWVLLCELLEKASFFSALVAKIQEDRGLPVRTSK